MVEQEAGGIIKRSPVDAHGESDAASPRHRELLHTAVMVDTPPQAIEP